MESTTPLPGGTVTLLFTDIEGSTKLWEEHPATMRVALARHDAILREAIEAHRGHVFKTMGDQFCVAFATAPDALVGALEAQRVLLSEAWGEPGPLRVRMALHTGAAEARAGDYFGPPLNRVARLLDAGHGGQILLSQAAADLVRDGLPKAASLRELGAHRLKDLQQPERLFQLVHPELPGEFPPLRSLEAFAHNLPRQLTSFVGREHEMAEVKRLLAVSALLTLTGSGGCGKTRLALQVAAELLEEYADGVWLVELAALADPALVPQAVASVLGVREEPGRPLVVTLTDSLRSKSLLLVIDNCEHLLSACAQVADHLLRACPDLRILASSREALGITGEQTYRVPSLSLPHAGQLPPLERLRDFEAVQLFADRARLSQASFAVTQANAPAVTQVCQRLDGIPLAIELAAARVRALPVEQIHERLDDIFRLLTGGSRTALPRQQTLRALIDWSFDLLSEGEQTLLRRLSVFVGGWTLGAAEGVCAGESVEAWDVLDLLTSLVDKSLVVYDEQGGEGRYRLLETVRQYARDRLLESGEAEGVRERHCDWFLVLAEQAEPKLQGPEDVVWMDRLEAEHDNLRAALGWSGAPGQGEVGLRMAAALCQFWQRRGYWTEGRERLAGLLALPGAQARTAARAKALLGSGTLANYSLDHRAARALAEESLAICRELGGKRGIASSLRVLGTAALGQGERGTAQALLEESLAMHRELGDTRDIAWSLQDLGAALGQGDYEAARTLMEESLAVCRELEDKRGILWSLLVLGRAAGESGDIGAARALYEESLGIAREVGDKPVQGNACLAQGHLLLELGDYTAARSCCEEGLAIRRERGNKNLIAAALLEVGHVAWLQGESLVTRSHALEALALFSEWGNQEGRLAALESLGVAALAQGRRERAARLLAAVEALCEGLGLSGPGWWRRPRERMGEAVRAASLEQAFAGAWAEGRAMALDDAMEYALEEPGDDPPRE